MASGVLFITMWLHPMNESIAARFARVGCYEAGFRTAEQKIISAQTEGGVTGQRLHR